MALPHLLLLFLVSFSVDATQPPRTLHVPVLHRDAVFPPPPGAPPSRSSSLLLRLHAEDTAAHYTVQLAPSLHSTAAADADDNDRLRSPVLSGLPFDSGEYFAAIGVGDPPTRALVVIDTGSDLTWLQCAPCLRCYRQLTPLYDPRRSTSYAPIPCASPRCRGVLRYPGCDARTGGCVYMVVYGDGSSSTGALATDRLVFFPGDDGARAVHHNVTIGCGRNNGGLLDSAAGVLGVGRGALSFPAQAAATYGRVFSYCLGDRAARERGRGTSRPASSSAYLVFGRASEPPSTAFTPLRTNPRRPGLYYVDMGGFSVGGERVAAGSGLALDRATGRGGVVIDSGTAISRFPRDAYAAVRDAFDARAAAGGARRVDANLSVFDACYDLRGGGGRGATVRVPSVVLHFAGGADMVLPPANYLVPVVGGDRRTYFCLGLQVADDGLNVLGNVQQQGFGVTFDVERGRIGFAPNVCVQPK